MSASDYIPETEAWIRGFATALASPETRPHDRRGIVAAMRAAGLTVELLEQAGVLPSDVDAIRECYPKEDP